MDIAIVKKFLELRDGLYVIADMDGYRIGINRQRGRGDGAEDHDERKGAAHASL